MCKALVHSHELVENLYLSRAAVPAFTKNSHNILY